HFSLAGIARREIEKVEIVSPDLYVGEHLFWYIDYFRRLQSGEDAAASGEVPPGKTGEVIAKSEPSPDPDPEWKIKAIEAHHGRLILAPKGYPVGFNPFPFTASTDLESGAIDLNLSVPEGTYSYADLDLELEDLTGAVQFNLPIKQEDNNLVETFTMRRLRFKQYQAEKVYASLTYDSKGFYGRFGGDAYGGYVEGAFNIHVREIYHWDAWVAGTGVDLEPLTKIVAPEIVRMKGKINVKLVGEGEELAINTGHGDFEMLGAGHLEITKLEEILAELPPEWDPLQESLARAGIEALQNFPFEQGEGAMRYGGDGGSLKLSLRGTRGSRNIELNYHDRRPGGAGSVEDDAKAHALSASSP
ncbi:MAG: hypothetical protein ACC661_04165, partial [Verrucomicrobiales bacterium]